jgi:hypothetical protein
MILTYGAQLNVHVFASVMSGCNLQTAVYRSVFYTDKLFIDRLEHDINSDSIKKNIV